MNFTVGQVVYSKCGHDKGKAFIITSLEENFAYIADGCSRTLDKPKRKKLKHLQVTGCIFEDIKRKILDKEYILNSDIKKALIEYSKKIC